MWRDAFMRELRFWAEKTGKRPLTSIHFGGGTPSLMSPGLVESIIDYCGDIWGFADDPEISLEANPTDAETTRFDGFALAGVNRLSLGVQALHDAALAKLGRNHDSGAARAAIRSAKSAFPRVSIDLIYARPEQTTNEWRDELREALDLTGQHISLYQLTVEPGTAFERAQKRGALRPPSDDLTAALYEMTQEVCEMAGLSAYEVSNHAAPGEESRHNLLYWRMDDFIGAGPGAHGRVSLNGATYASENMRAPAAYIDAIHRGEGAWTELTRLSPDELDTERLLMGLRLREGADLTRLNSSAFRRRVLARCDELVQEGWMEIAGDRLRATQKGRAVLDQLASLAIG